MFLLKNETGNLFKRVKNERQKEYFESLGYRVVEKTTSITNPKTSTAPKKATAKKGEKSKDVKLD
ncbi:MAG: hypothetical protein IJO19_00215 [Clostridia bacterium]|nr:hypothetical protein [Clostridia bacterium]